MRTRCVSDAFHAHQLRTRCAAEAYKMRTKCIPDISKLGGKVVEVIEVMNWEVMNSCSNGSNEVAIDLQNDHVVMKMAHGVIM